MALDKVQKQLPIELEMADYVQNKAFNKKYYSDLVYELIKKQNLRGTKRKEINSLLITKLSKTMTEEQKDNYIRNLLHQMVLDKRIISEHKKYYLCS